MTCIPPCQNVILFSKGMLVPYGVTDQAVQRGFAELDDCQPVARNENNRASMSKRDALKIWRYYANKGQSIDIGSLHWTDVES
jgi:hypothetical protein